MIRLSQSHLDIEDPALRAVFADLQGNILKSHGRDHSRHVFLRFTADSGRCRDWICGLAPQVTSALEQHRTAQDYRTTGTEHLFTGIMLTCAGYQALGVDDSKWPDDKAFRAGMKDHEFVYDTGPRGVHSRSTNPLQDDLTTWERFFLGRIDALVVLAYGGSGTDPATCNQVLDEQVELLGSGARDVAEVLSVQQGYALRNERGHVMEHFGFADGVSNPLFMKSDLLEAEREGGCDRYDPAAPFALVAVRDPGGRFPTDSYGTYFVYRKLQQNIVGFRKRVEELAAALSAARGRPVTPEVAGALVIGRFADGTPIVSRDAAPQPACNNFNYDDDVDGERCPLHSHIRKTNPRGDTQRRSGLPAGSERARRIVRRGISYGAPDLVPEAEWSDAGLLFLACQSDIEQQFLVMQCGWSGNPDFVAPGIGLDPVLGKSESSAAPRAQRWPIGQNRAEAPLEFRFSDFVRTRGGEYFFAPSLSFLADLQSRDSPNGEDLKPPEGG